MRGSAIHLCFGLCLLAIACADESTRTARTSLDTDTIDFRTTKGAAIATEEAARVSSTALNLTPIDRMRMMVMLKTGGVAVAQPMSQRIVFFGSDGEVLGEFGRSGGGPGEFRTVSALGFIGDTLWAGDTRQDRATLIGANRELLRTFNLPSVEFANSADRQFKVLMGLDSDGFLALAPSEGERLFRANLNGVVLNLLPPRIQENRAVQIGSVTSQVDLFDASSKVDVSADAKTIAIVRHILDGPGAPAASLSVLKSTGDTAYVRIIEFATREIPKSSVDSAISAATRGRPPEYAEAYRRQAYIPRFYPPVKDVLIGQDGRTWLKLQPAAGRQEYLVLGADGDLIGTVVFPPRTSVRSASGSFVWVFQFNEFEVADIVKYAIADFAAGR